MKEKCPYTCHIRISTAQFHLVDQREFHFSLRSTDQIRSQGLSGLNGQVLALPELYSCFQRLYGGHQSPCNTVHFAIGIRTIHHDTRLKPLPRWKFHTNREVLPMFSNLRCTQFTNNVVEVPRQTTKALCKYYLTQQFNATISLGRPKFIFNNASSSSNQVIVSRFE